MNIKRQVLFLFVLLFPPRVFAEQEIKAERKTAVEFIDLMTSQDQRAVARASMAASAVQLHFPSSYGDLWNVDENSLLTEQPPLIQRAQLLLRDYVNNWSYFHFDRHFIKDETLLAICASLKYRSPEEILDILNMLRTQTFERRYPGGVYGYQPYGSSYSHYLKPKVLLDPATRKAFELPGDGPDLIRVRTTPGSLYARCRFILIMSLRHFLSQGISLNERYSKMVAQNWRYYLLSPGISYEKHSTSLGRRISKFIVAGGTISLAIYLGPIIAHSATTGLEQFGSACGTACESAVHHASEFVAHVAAHGTEVGAGLLLHPVTHLIDD